MEDTYVDDIITGADDAASAIKLARGLTATLRQGGFELGQWISSSEEVLDVLQSKTNFSEPTEVPFDTKNHQGTRTCEPQRALGVVWLLSSDCLTYRSKVTDGTATKRNILATVMSVFDPLGLLASWLLKPRILIQELRRRTLDWDEPVPEVILRIWDNWFIELASVGEVRIPRYLFSAWIPDEIPVHVFCNASLAGFAAVLYFRWVNAANRADVALACARARVATLKNLTVPRLELQAAVLAVRMLKA